MTQAEKGIIRNPHEETKYNDLLAAAKEVLSAARIDLYSPEFSDAMKNLEKLVAQTPKQWEKENKKRAKRFDKWIGRWAKKNYGAGI